MLTNEQLKEIEERANDAGAYLIAASFYKSDVNYLLSHIRELTQKSMCEHSWIYFFDKGFECHKCKKKKDRA